MRGERAVGPHGQRGFLLSGAQDLLRPWRVQS